MSGLITTTGRIDWVDLSTPSIDQALEFYRTLFGWDVHADTSPMGTYYVGMAHGDDAAGLMQRTEEVPSALPAMWMVYIRVESVDEAAARARLLGASQVHDPFDIPGGSRIAVLADPAGAVFTIVSGPSGMSMARHAPGTVMGCELLTRDLSTALHFYVEMFGWEPSIDLDSGYVTFHRGDSEVAGMMAMPPEVPNEAPSHWVPYFEVVDCRAACATVERLGGELAMARRRTSTQDVTIEMAVAEDPQGAVFGLIEAVT